MIIAVIILSIVFFSIAFIVTENNAKDLLSGYNTMSEEERKNFDIASYIPFFRKFHIFLGISLLIISLLLFYFIDVDWTGMFLGIYPLLAYAYFIWKSNSFYTTKTKKQNGIAIVSISVILIVLVVIIYQFKNGLENNEILVTNTKIEITGDYGSEIDINDLKSIQLIDELPKITSKIHGFDLEIIKKGYFNTKENERVKLLINSEKKPLLLIVTNHNQKIYYSSKEKFNQEIYDELKRKLNSKNIIF